MGTKIPFASALCNVEQAARNLTPAQRAAAREALQQTHGNRVPAMKLLVHNNHMPQVVAFAAIRNVADPVPCLEV